MPDFRRGAAEIQKAVEAAKGNKGDFRPFLQNFYWQGDGDHRYLLILNPVEEVPRLLAFPKIWAGDGGPPRAVISRKDPAIGEREDPIADKWDYRAQEVHAAVAVELEPEVEVMRGRPRPVAFSVKTRTFQRRIRDEKGELTDEREEMTAPVVGLILQSPQNFFSHVASKDNTVGPIHEIPICVTRVGGDQHTSYEIDCFEDKELDLSGLLDFVDGISYINDEMDEVVAAIEDKPDNEAAAIIGGVLLDKRLNELADPEYYNEVFETITEPSRWGKKNKESQSKGNSKAQERRRASQVRSRKEDKEDVKEEKEEAPAEEAKPQTRRRQRSGTKREAGNRDAVNRDSSVRERLSQIRDKGEAVAS